MKIISAEEANKTSCSNNAMTIEVQGALEKCMAKIKESASVGSYSAKCNCKKDLVDMIAGRLKKEFGYNVSLPYPYNPHSLWTEEGIVPSGYFRNPNFIEFNVSWDGHST